MSLDISPDDRKPKGEPSSLVNQLEHYYKQFTYFGLDECYIEQLFKQVSEVLKSSLHLILD
jgi:hypothetical protein